VQRAELPINLLSFYELKGRATGHFDRNMWRYVTRYRTCSTCVGSACPPQTLLSFCLQEGAHAIHGSKSSAAKVSLAVRLSDLALRLHIWESTARITTGKPPILKFYPVFPGKFPEICIKIDHDNFVLFSSQFVSHSNPITQRYITRAVLNAVLNNPGIKQ
jgi:hypothetical protein